MFSARRQWIRWPWILLLVLCVGVMTRHFRQDRGEVVVQFERWEGWTDPPRLVLSVHNGTGRSVSVSGVVSKGLTATGPNVQSRMVSGGTNLKGWFTGSISMALFSSDVPFEAIPSGSKCTIYVTGFPAKDPMNEFAVYVHPWTAEEMTIQIKRRGNWPKFITRWLRPYSTRDPRYRYTVEVPEAPEPRRPMLIL